MANVRYSVECPSCDAAVPIRSSSMIGRKTECPKCKFRFVVPEPPEEGDAKGGKAKKGNKSAAKKGNKTIVYAGAGLGVLAVVLLVVAGIFLMGRTHHPGGRRGGRHAQAEASQH
jgi:DNA-directed RNA polymerase subunit RPC12/RpoP